jgi:hypothetical protein
VVGAEHTYADAGGLVAGYNNSVSAWVTSVCGGEQNTASTTWPTVHGSQGNGTTVAYDYLP